MVDVTINRDELKQEIAQFFAQLGDTPDAVYRNLLQRGCKGLDGDPWECPIARGLEKALGEKIQAAGYITSVMCDECWLECDGDNEVVALTAPATAFIQKFDEGDYPDLKGE